MKIGGRIFLTLFGLPFFSVGVFMLYSITMTFYDSHRASSWDIVPAKIHSASLDSSYSDGSTTYEAKVAYEYRYNNRYYTGSRVGLGAVFGESSGGDNIGSYQEDMASMLQRKHRNNELLNIYVNPANPTESVVDPAIRWGLVGFKMIFVIIFGGMGTGVLVYAIKGEGSVDKSKPEFQLEPWKAEKNWQSPVIRSDAKMTLYVAWGFAIFWNAISSFIPFVIYQEAIKGGEHGVWFAAIFPLVGIGMIYWAVKETLKWRKFGVTPLTMRPFPGEIGGTVGGTIDINIPFKSDIEYKIKLHNIYTWVSGSGKNSSRHKDIRWAAEDQLVRAQPGVSGITVPFDFKVPDDLNESDASPDTRNYHMWQLHVSADMPGVDFDRTFTIPVYKRR